MFPCGYREDGFRPGSDCTPPRAGFPWPGSRGGRPWPSARPAFGTVTPFFWQSSTRRQSPQRGRRARHTARPWSMRRWLKAIQCSRGTTRTRSRSAPTASVRRVRPIRRVIRPTWVSTTIPSASPNPTPSTTLAVFLPTPGRATSSASVRGTAPVPLHKGPATTEDVAGLGPEKPRAPDRLLEILLPGGGEFCGRPPATEQLRGDHVHPLVRALGRENRRHNELEGGVEFQRAARVGIERGQAEGHAPSELGPPVPSTL